MTATAGYRVDTERLMTGVLSASAEEGARIIALHWLGGIADSRARMLDTTRPAQGPGSAEGSRGESDDGANLHKARVALRRLRAVLREHQDLIDIGKRLPKA